MPNLILLRRTCFQKCQLATHFSGHDSTRYIGTEGLRNNFTSLILAPVEGVTPVDVTFGTDDVAGIYSLRILPADTSLLCVKNTQVIVINNSQQAVI